jgi:P27 family predicted phage terminase small subunit
VRLEGNRDKRKLPKADEEVKADAIAPSMPKDLDGEARAEWKRIVPLLMAMGIIGQVDRAALVELCQAWSIGQQARAVLRKKGLTMKMMTKGGGMYEMQRPEVAIAHKFMGLHKTLCSEFGLTASARARMSIAGAKSKDDFDDLEEGTATNA